MFWLFLGCDNRYTMNLVSIEVSPAVTFIAVSEEITNIKFSNSDKAEGTLL